MLTINNITVKYGSKKVLQDLDLTIQENYIHGLIGLNGAGKTTLYNTIYGIKRAVAGTIELNGEKISAKDISFFETQNYFYPNITGKEYLKLFPSNSKGFDLSVWQKMFNIPLNKLVDSYSNGMKKKLALLGILKLDKKIILMDEPFNGVDLETSRVIKILLNKLKERKKTIIVTSHILETLTGSCDYIHHLKDKQIKRTYSREEMNNIESDIFSEMELRTSDAIDKAI